ncbi:MAG: hypothetical protein B7X80_08710 [Sulfurovum sp. 17-42-90]|nr:MAG: hypothetical protein B7X80_08710 [Sulfurovum sp. 17-42-90]
MKKIILLLTFMTSFLFSEVITCTSPKFWDLDENYGTVSGTATSTYCNPDKPATYEYGISENYKETYTYSYPSTGYTCDDLSPMTKQLYTGVKYNCVTCTEPDVPFPNLEINQTITDSWTKDDQFGAEKSLTCEQNGDIVQTAKYSCQALFQCVTETTPKPAPCENPQLIRDSNGTCDCPDYSDDFDEQYQTCLPSHPECPIKDPTSIYDNTTGICYRYFYDCTDTLYKQTETTPLNSDQCKNPLRPDEDTDGDGIPDTLDDDIDGDGIPNNQDPDIDGDGTPNNLDADSNRGAETNSSTPIEDLCRLKDPNSYKNGNQCSCNPGYQFVSGVCTKDPDKPDPCAYPSTNSRYDFQGTTLTRSACVDQYTYWSNNGRGITAKLDTCDKYGCYYNTGAYFGDENVSDTSVSDGTDINNDGLPDFTDGNGTTGEDELNREDAGELGDLIGDALSDIQVDDFVVVNSSGTPPPARVNVAGKNYEILDFSDIPYSAWETMQLVFKWIAILSGIITIFATT